MKKNKKENLKNHFIPFTHYEHDDDAKNSNIDPLPSTPFIQTKLEKIEFLMMLIIMVACTLK
jgi:hypothetical protein